jgi:REP element-mobilizing transposase RayT
MAATAVDLFIHLVFCTKYRERHIHPEIEDRLHSYLVGIAKNRKTKVLRINGMEDHVHILINLHPSIALSNLVKELKAYSTSWMKKNGYPKFSWQRGYGGFSYSKSMTDQVVKYIENQKEHHRKFSLKEEIELIKQKWGIQWNWEDDEDGENEE